MVDDTLQEEECTVPELVEGVRAGTLGRRQLVQRLARLGMTAAGIGAIVAAATTPAVSAPFTALHKGEHAAHQKRLHDQHLQYQTTGQGDALRDDYSEDAIVEDSMFPQAFVGREAILARKAVGMAAIPNLQIQVVNRVTRGQQLLVEWTASGTHSGQFHELAASGKDFTISGVTVVVRSNGKIVRESLYYDMAEVHRQLGPARK